MDLYGRPSVPPVLLVSQLAVVIATNIHDSPDLRHTGPPSSILDPPLTWIFSMFQMILSKKYIFFGTKTFLDLENFSIFFFLIFIMDAKPTLYLPQVFLTWWPNPARQSLDFSNPVGHLLDVSSFKTLISRKLSVSVKISVNWIFL